MGDAGIGQMIGAAKRKVLLAVVAATNDAVGTPCETTAPVSSASGSRSIRIDRLTRYPSMKRAYTSTRKTVPSVNKLIDI